VVRQRWITPPEASAPPVVAFDTSAFQIGAPESARRLREGLSDLSRRRNCGKCRYLLKTLVHLNHERVRESRMPIAIVDSFFFFRCIKRMIQDLLVALTH